MARREQRDGSVSSEAIPASEGRAENARPGGPPSPTLVLLVVVAVGLVAACAGPQGPPDIEEVRDDLAREHHVVYSGRQGHTVLELLEEHADSVQTRGSGADLLVESINGIAGGSDGRYWFYYVNGEAGKVAASRRQTADGDRVEWIFAR